MESNRISPMNRCGHCGATSYRRAVARDLQGAMRYAERLVCTGCTHEYSDVQAWRDGLPGTPPAAAVLS